MQTTVKLLAWLTRAVLASSALLFVWGMMARRQYHLWGDVYVILTGSAYFFRRSTGATFNVPAYALIGLAAFSIVVLLLLGRMQRELAPKTSN